MCSHTCNSQLLRRNCLAFILQFPSLYSGGTGTNTRTILTVTVVLVEIVALYVFTLQLSGTSVGP